MTDPKKQIAVPSSARVECPKTGAGGAAKKWRRASDCDGCEHYRGLVERMNGEHLAFGARYLVGCAHPIGRAIIEVED